jgi:hypothetical protein
MTINEARLVDQFKTLPLGTVTRFMDAAALEASHGERCDGYAWNDAMCLAAAKLWLSREIGGRD